MASGCTTAPYISVSGLREKEMEGNHQSGDFAENG
jgi:hypothetical protein